MSTPSPCPRCGSTSSTPRTDDLCPRCLVAVNFDSHTFENTQTPNTFDLPNIDELAAKLPDFELIECLGRGGMGIVYKARQKSLDRLIAIKILTAEQLGTERFEQEARTLAKLNHPNIVTVHDSGTSKDIFYIIMEYVDGVTLRDVIRDGQLSTEEAVKIVPAICEALEYAHEQGIVHRDIKPENILLDRSGAVKLADFGIAKMLDAESTERAGTPAYMAPEEQTDHRSDIYALGVVLYELLTGEQPPRDLAKKQNIQIDVRIDEIVLRALDSNPEQRYQTAAEFRTQVQTVSGLSSPVPVGEWQLRCASCGNTRPVEAPEGINSGPLSFGKKTDGYCHTCATVRPLLLEKSDGKAHLVTEKWRWESFDYRSKKTLFGYPLLNIAMGTDPSTGKRRTAKGFVAIGDRAIGIISMGTISFGVFSFGAVGIGAFSMGGLALGLLAYGGAAIGLIFSFGGFALAPIAYGGYAIGYYAAGGVAHGAELIDHAHKSPAAKEVFERIKAITGDLFDPRATQIMIFAAILTQLTLVDYGRRKANNKPYTRNKAASISCAFIMIATLTWLLFFRS